MAAGVARRRWRSLDRDRTAGGHPPPRGHSEDPGGAFEVPDRGSRRPRGCRHHHRPPRRPTYPRLGPPGRRPIGPGHIVPAGSPRVRNEGARGEVHSRRWRTGSTSRRRARAPCTPGRSWPNGSSPARTRRSPSSRSGVTRGFVRCVRRCASAGGPGRGPGRGSRDSFVRSVAVRPNAEGGGLARRPGARVRDWVGDGADVWRYQFGSQCVGNERTRGRKAPICEAGSSREPFLANHELKNSRVRRRIGWGLMVKSEIRPPLFLPGRDDVPTLLDGSPWRRVDFSEQPRPATSTLSMR